MYIKKNFSPSQIWKFSGGHIIWISIWVLTVTLTYKFTGWTWLSIPWLPISVVGTAVAFYIGFKNNQAYDRLWEARKIWGGIVNSSRSWGIDVKSFVSNLQAERTKTEQELHEIHKTLIYRHIGWLYTLRKLLLIPTNWEHINQHPIIAKVTKKRQSKMGLGMLENQETKLNILLNKIELENLYKYKNPATNLIDIQAQELKSLREIGLIDDFRHMELQKMLHEFYELQGKAERIKKFPLPRQYASMSFVFVGIFIFLLPFGTVSEFASLGEFGWILSIPFTILIAWIYIMMELIGDYSENPFEGLGNDIPMLSLCRTIEIDLRQMLGETDLPNSIEPVNGILM